jgi:hypothetical protein
MAHLKVVSWHLHGKAEENDEKPNSGQPVTRPRFEHGYLSNTSLECYHWTDLLDIQTLNVAAVPLTL